MFVPGARCFGDVRGLFGGAASRVVLPAARTVAIDEALGEQRRAAGAGRHRPPRDRRRAAAQPDLIVGHGVLGRMLARLAVAAGASPVVWETNAGRRDGAAGYQVVDPALRPRGATIAASAT